MRRKGTPFRWRHRKEKRMEKCPGCGFEDHLKDGLCSVCRHRTKERKRYSKKAQH